MMHLAPGHGPDDITRALSNECADGYRHTDDCPFSAACTREMDGITALDWLSAHLTDTPPRGDEDDAEATWYAYHVSMGLLHELREALQ